MIDNVWLFVLVSTDCTCGTVGYMWSSTRTNHVNVYDHQFHFHVNILVCVSFIIRIDPFSVIPSSYSRFLNSVTCHKLSIPIWPIQISRSHLCASRCVDKNDYIWQTSAHTCWLDDARDLFIKVSSRQTQYISLQQSPQQHCRIGTPSLCYSVKYCKIKAKSKHRY